MGIKLRKRIASVIMFIFMAILAFIALFPFYYVFIGSIGDQSQLFSKGMQLYVTAETFHLVPNYANLFAYSDGIYITWY